MQFDIPDEVLKIITKFQEKQFEIYIVGGAIRDLLMGREVYDWDFTTNATPEEILQIFPFGFYDNAFGTVGIPSQTFKPHEITTFRTDGTYSDNRRPDKVSWGKNLEEDLQRRDFTINALAVSIQNSKIEIHDFFNGQKDLENKIIRAVGNPSERFTEDALRMMRAIRIASQLGFDIEAQTFEAIKNNSNLITKIAGERIRDEFLKLLASKNPGHGIMLLKDCGLLTYILPELDKAFEVGQKSPERHHVYDVGTHSVKALEFCKSPDPILRLACLLHDIGKPKTVKKLESGVITFYNHEVAGAKITKEIADRLRLSKKDRDRLWHLVRFHQFTVNENQTDSALRRFIRNVGKENLEDMLILRTADRLGGGAKETSWRLEEFKTRLIEVQKQPFSVQDLKINGNDIMEALKIKPGPQIGELLTKLFKEVEDKKVENEREALLSSLDHLHHQ